MKLVHWPLIGGLLHLVQRGGLEETKWGRSRGPLLALPNITAHPSAASVPITVLLDNGPLLCGFNVPIKVLKGGNGVKSRDTWRRESISPVVDQWPNGRGVDVINRVRDPEAGFMPACSGGTARTLSAAEWCHVETVTSAWRKSISVDDVPCGYPFQSSAYGQSSSR